MASYITLNDDLTCDAITIDNGAGFVTDGYNVVSSNVTMDTPLDFKMESGTGGDTEWTCSGFWAETVAGCTGTYSATDSILIMTGVGKYITKIVNTQYFDGIRVAMGASLAANSDVSQSYGLLDIYGSYDVSASYTHSCYSGSQIKIHSTGSLDFTGSTISIYDSVGGGGISVYHSDASITGDTLIHTYPQKSGTPSVLVPGDYSGIDTFRIVGGSAAKGELPIVTAGTYEFYDLDIALDGNTYATGLDLTSATDVIIRVNGALTASSGAYVNSSFYIDNSPSDVAWYFGDDVDLTGTTDCVWTKGTGIQVMLFGVNTQSLEFAGADIGYVYVTKTSGNVTFLGLTVELLGDFPGNVDLNDATCTINGLDNETINVDGTWTVSNGYWYLGADTTWNFYDDVDWSGAIDMSGETSMMVCKDDATWTWKDGSDEAPYSVTVDTGKTMSMVNAGSTYSYILGDVNVYGKIDHTDASLQYLSLSADATLSMYPYAEIELGTNDNLFFDTLNAGGGIILMNSTARIYGGDNILWDGCSEGSIIVSGTYELGLHVYGPASYIELDTNGDYQFDSMTMQGDVGSFITFTAPRNLTLLAGVLFYSGVATTYNIDTTSSEKIQVATTFRPGHATQTATINWVAGNGTIELTHGANQIHHVPITVNNDPIDRITVNLSDKTKYAGFNYADLYTKGVYVQSGQYYFYSGHDPYCEKDFVIGPDGNLDNVNGNTINAASISFRGESELSKTDMTFGSTWYCNASQGCQAYYVDLQNSTASGVAGVAFGSDDSGSNVNWSFETVPNTIVAPSSGLSFIMHTLQDVEINASNYALGFFGDDRFDTLATDEWSGHTFLTDIGGTIGEVQCRNVKYASDSTAYVDHLLTPVALQSIPNYLGTLNIRMLDDEDIFVAIAEGKFYDGHDPANPPNGINIKMAELRHIVPLLNDTDGRGDAEWRDVGDGATFSLTQSPGLYGVKSSSVGYWVYSQHDWYLALSVSPQVVGDREFGLQITVEYL